jgi:Xaa-Pro dipeptidase
MVQNEKRCAKVQAWMEAENVALVMFMDFENARDQAVRYLTGQPGDALFFLSRDGMLLVPWDYDMALKCSSIK